MATRSQQLPRWIGWDGNNLFRRQAANKGLSQLRYKGRATGAIHGTVKSIIEMCVKYKPRAIVVVFDGSGARKEKQKIYSEYKSQRMSSMDDGLYQQMMVIRDILLAAGVCVLQKAGVDGDDALGALVRHLPEYSKLIVSNDKDFLQCVDARCRTLRYRGEGPEIWTPRTVKQHYGVRPNQFADYLALCGDGVDNIPGLKNCGPKTAVPWLEKYGSLKNIIRSSDALGDRWRRQIQSQQHELKKFQRLTTLDTSVISDVAMQGIRKRMIPGAYSNELQALCADNGLKWIGSWFAAHPHGIVAATKGLWS